MAFITVKECRNDDDLNKIVLDINQELGDVSREIDAIIDQIVVDDTALNTSLALDQATTQAPNPLTGVSDQAGLPEINPSELTDEQRLELLGIIMIRGVLYLANQSGNITALRRLFFALGSDVTLFLEVLNSQDKFVVVQTFLNVQKLPLRSSWTVADAQETLQNPAIEAVYTARDGETYCVVPQFLAVNKSKTQVADESFVEESQIITQLFWLGSIQTDSSVINRLSLLGITGDERTSALSGRRLIEIRPTSKIQTEGLAGVETQKALDAIQLLDGRFNLVTDAAREEFRSLIEDSVLSARKYWFDLQDIVRFYPTIIERPQDISDFLVRNTRDDLSYLFSKRRTVTGINFQATPAQVISAVRQILSVSSGTATMSAVAVNRSEPEIDRSTDEANRRLVQNTCGMRAIQTVPINYDKLTIAYGCLSASLEITTEPPIRLIPQVGYESYDSPATILFRRGDIYITLGFEKVIADFEKAFANAAEPVRKFLSFIVALFRQIKKTIDEIFKKIKSKLSVYLAQIEAMISRYTSLVGTVTLDASLLRCAFGYDLSADLPILQVIQNLILDAERLLRNSLAQVAQIVSTFLSKVICYPLNLINGFLSGLESQLPDFCEVYKIKLPVSPTGDQSIEDLLIELRNMFDFQGDIGRSYQRDLFRINASLRTAPEKVSSFQESLACESEQKGNLFKQARNILNVSQRIPNPLNSIPRL